MEVPDYSTPLKAKSIDNSMDRFKIAPETEPQFGHYVELTAKLIKRTYMQTFLLVQKWPLEKIIERYELSTKHAGDMPGDIKWWWLRKTKK